MKKNIDDKIKQQADRLAALRRRAREAERQRTAEREQLAGKAILAHLDAPLATALASWLPKSKLDLFPELTVNAGTGGKNESQ